MPDDSKTQIEYDRIMQGVACTDTADGEPCFSWPLFDYMVELSKCAVDLHKLGAPLSCAVVLDSLRLVNKAATDGIIPRALRDDGRGGDA